ncbi:MAG TPA: class I SAM-dependent methyltransferase [Anaerolineaceae bacterium]|nr:class I SAM-dependent methyltransferase [Anaerolineaceae bacterium]
MTQEFPPSDFDDWAATYDESVAPGSGFPFYGYQEVLQTIFQGAALQAGSSVLDLGIGTGNLAARFAQAGCEIWGVDFSKKMIELAARKLPRAYLAVADIRSEWPPEFQRRFSAIVSAYTFHHFPLQEKVVLVKRLMSNHLEPGGRMVIGDIAFSDAASEDALRKSLGNDWEQEYYWLADETLAVINAAGIPAKYTQISSCAGIFEFKAGKTG